MKRYTSWTLAFLMLIGLFGFVSISLAEEGKWTKKADMPTARMAFSTSAVNGKIYAIGGVVGLKKGDVISIVEEYDPLTDTWTKKADMPTARAWLSTSVVNEKIYAIGGHGIAEHLSTVEEYDPVTDKWTKKTNMPTGRLDLSTSMVNGKIYAIGGSNGDAGISTLEYDPLTGKWTKKANMSTPRAGLSASVVNEKIYAIGGVRGIVEEYDPATDRWTRKADMPTARRGLSTSVVNDKVSSPMILVVFRRRPSVNLCARSGDLRTSALVSLLLKKCRVMNPQGEREYKEHRRAVCATIFAFCRIGQGQALPLQKKGEHKSLPLSEAKGSPLQKGARRAPLQIYLISSSIFLQRLFIQWQIDLRVSGHAAGGKLT